ncbi:hypothetical protein K3165_09200 [Qipengyuania sp. 1XM1-15A]|uniref:TonB-dependent receptor plug domain-containing protein n=1 Tax=Qipengyuania xiamenensis TaxID=2867237 RepID=UPI001C87C947|nr:TonB-dependent receptor plug domain-containing protein [Qipengyuania xiamenensis]MBX7533095.1 hypothetical protein [Qipengyuania xiamenensis]
MARSQHFTTSIIALAFAGATPAWANEDPSPSDAASGDPNVPSQPVTEGARVFEPSYFEQFAPRNALEMVDRLPGFSISGGNDQGQRGLGQANQNVIVNGERFSSKSDSIRDQLARIPAGDVIRIELVDGNSLDIPGLTGLVANVIYESKGASGQFRYNPGFRPYNTEARYLGGEISLTGSDGPLDFTVSLSNENNRFGADGPILVTAADGSLIEEQQTKFSGGYDNPKLATNFTYDFGGGAFANLNLSYGEDFVFRDMPETGFPTAGPVRFREATYHERGPEYEIGGDIEFPLGPGKLKIIGLERFERDIGEAQLIDTFDDGSDPKGSRFERTDEEGERIGRFEYGWNMWSADWQLSGEAAFNRLDRRSKLFLLDDSGQFERIAFPAGNGGVTEDRYEAILSYSTQLSPTLSLQATGGAEYSKIEQTGSAANSRSFQRPKGSLALSWKPADDFDVSLTAARRVGQLSFGAFLGSVNLNDDNQNGGNNSLVPPQSWEFDLEVNKGLGAWGLLKFEAKQAYFEDFIDWFPLANGGEAQGNIGDAKRTHLELTGTINLDPIGWKGARLDFNGVKRWMSVTDAFTGEDRVFSNDLVDRLEVNFRYDIPDSDWAVGNGINTFNPAGYSRRYETGRGWEGPTFGWFFVEHKDVMGLTVRALAGNMLGARNYFERTVYEGDRPDAPIAYREYMDRRIGPIFNFRISGDF